MTIRTAIAAFTLTTAFLIYGIPAICYLITL